MAVKKGADQGICVLQVTDPHVTREGRKAFRVVDTHARLAETVSAILDWESRNQRADAVVVSGDLVLFGRDEEYARFREAMAPLDGRYHVIPGNHDNRASLRRAFRDHEYLPKRGPLDWRLSLHGLEVIGLDSLVEGSACGMIGSDSLGWLVDAIAIIEGAPLLLAVHHPPFMTGIEDIDRDALENADALIAALSLHKGPLQVISGHAHRRLDAPKVRGPSGQAKTLAGAPMTAPPCFPALVRRLRPGAAGDFEAEPGGFMAHHYEPEDGFHSELVEVGELAGELPRLS